jgi:thymidylate synthase (FAD)
MKLAKQEWSFIRPNFTTYPSKRNDDLYNEILDVISMAYRLCYASEPKADNEPYIRSKIKLGHTSVIEHASVTISINTNIGVSREIMRHRIGVSPTEQSTRYCNFANDKFGNEITVIVPVWFENDIVCVDGMIKPKDNASEEFILWYNGCHLAENTYLDLIKIGQKPQQARENLPLATQTRILMTMTIRAWRHFFELRCSKTAHPNMINLAASILGGFKMALPVFFDDIK